MRTLWCLAALAALLLALSACERPFVDESRPDVEVVAPDLSVVLTDASPTLRVSAGSFRPVDSVLVGDEPLAYDPVDRVWEGQVPLRAGLNALRITAVDRSGAARHDTAYAVYLPFTFGVAAPVLPQPRGGHAATSLADGSVLVTGGAPAVGRPGTRTAYLLPRGASRFHTVPDEMRAPRVWHTATLLPDGRVLIVGGSRSYDVESLGDLVAPVELFDPETGRFVTVPYDGPPIRRARHTASVRRDAGGLLLDLYGGVGDVRYGDDPRLGVRRDLGVYALRNDSLFVASPSPGFRLSGAEPVAGHTQTPLTLPAAGRPAEFLVAGARPTDARLEAVGFVLDFTDPAGLFTRPAPAPHVPRLLHGAELLRSGYVFLAGGTQGNPSEALSAPELYIQEADRYFRLPEPGGYAPVKRFGLSVTKSAAGRILLIGGFSPVGNATPSVEVFRPASF